MLSRSQKRVVLGAAVLVALVLFAVPSINIGRYKSTVADSLTQALGRTVTIQNISIQTFPQPGLLLKGVVVADDASISAEPMLRDDADEGVLATLRLSSLWRGRLEIGTLKLNYPSLNLVRSTDGRWNIESVLERVRQTPSAPTTNKTPEQRSRFPYIEANGGRINLKIGQEKKVFALGDADFALWAPAENEWRMRLEAKPIRTDANLSDTGTVKAEGSWKRASQLRDTPVNFKFWWNDGQLGQLTRLVYGNDKGWRGAVRISGLVLGTPENLKIVTDARLDDFRRYDIATSESLSLQTHCDAFYSLSQNFFHDLYCHSPLGGGTGIARGSFATNPQNRTVDLSFSAENVSAQFMASLARHMKKDLPRDLSAGGVFSATLTVRAGEDGIREWAGSGTTSDLQLNSTVLDKPLLIAASRWHLIGPGTEQFVVKRPSKKNGHQQNTTPEPETPAFTFDPISIALGGKTNATMRGWFSRYRFFTEVTGEADIDRLFQVAKAAGLPTTAADLSGTATGDFRLSGIWSDRKLPDYSADAKLEDVKAKISGVASPMSIHSARFVADEESFNLNKAAVSFPDVHSNIIFNAEWPKNCIANRAVDDAHCGIRFSATADQVSVDELNALLNPRAQKRPWYAAIANTVMGSQQRSFPDIYATGTVTLGKLIVKGVPAAHFNADVSVSPSGFAITNATADVFGGKLVGELVSDFRGGTPLYSSKGRFQNVVFNNVSTWMGDDWASGKLGFSYEGKAAGWNAEELLSSAAGQANFDWRDGVLRHVELDPAGKPLQFRSFRGTVELKDGKLTIAESKLQAPKGIYQVSGTASLGRELEFRLARDGAPGFSVSGPLERPKVVPLKVPQTQATLR